MAPPRTENSRVTCESALAVAVTVHCSEHSTSLLTSFSPLLDGLGGVVGDGAGFGARVGSCVAGAWVFSGWAVVGAGFAASVLTGSGEVLG